LKKMILGMVMSLAILVGVTQVNANPIHEAAIKGDVAEIQRLLRYYPGLLNTKDGWGGMTALILAADSGHKDAVIQLLHHPDIDVNATGNCGMTALMHAANSGHKDTVIELLQHPKININSKDNCGWTALELANDEEIKQLIEDYPAIVRGRKIKSARKVA
jgi:ankyrin repeat protein